MTAWENMTEAQKSEANETAYAQACDRLRAVFYRTDAKDMDTARKFAADELCGDMREAIEQINYGGRSRATRMDKRVAEYAVRTLQGLQLIEGFIWDAEI